MTRYENANPSAEEQFSTHIDGTKGQQEWKWEGTAGARMPISVIYRCLSFSKDRMKELISEYISGFRWIHIVCSIKNQRAWDFFHDITFLDPVTTRHHPPFKFK
jgi:hypothetical protein